MAAIQTTPCPKCGKENRIGSRFCAHCGAPLPVSEAEQFRQAKPTALEIPKDEAVEAAKKIWDLTKTVITVGGRTAWQEVSNPPAVLEGKVTDKFKVEAVTPPTEWAFWAFVFWSLALLVFALKGQWLVTLISTAVTLVFSWLRWRRPYFSLSAWKQFQSLFGKPAQVPSLHLKLQTQKGELQTVLFGEVQGDEPNEGEYVRVFGIFDDKTQTKLRAWMIHSINDSGQVRGQPFTASRLFPLMPTMFFCSLVTFILAILLNWLR